MDLVHHAVIGTAGCLAAFSVDQPLVGISFLFGKVFPDLDVLFIAFGKRFFLRNHQGISHSLLLSPMYAAAIFGTLTISLDEPWDWPAYAACLLGIVLHLGLDWFNTYRIAIFSPFTFKRYSLDAVFVIDIVAWALTGLFFGIMRLAGAKTALATYVPLFVAYFLSKLLLRRRVVHRLQPLHVIPSGVNPLAFFVVTRSGQGVSSFLYNALTGSVRKERHYVEPPAEYARLAESSGLFRDMRRICRAFHIVSTSHAPDGITIQAADIAVRNFGGRFGKTVLKFDRENRLVHEMANI